MTTTELLDNVIQQVMALRYAAKNIEANAAGAITDEEALMLIRSCAYLFEEVIEVIVETDNISEWEFDARCDRIHEAMARKAEEN